MSSFPRICGVDHNTDLSFAQMTIIIVFNSGLDFNIYLYINLYKCRRLFDIFEKTGFSILFTYKYYIYIVHVFTYPFCL